MISHLFFHVKKKIKNTNLNYYIIILFTVCVFIENKQIKYNHLATHLVFF